MDKNVPLARLRFAEHVRPHDVIGWPQGPGEPLALTEALVVQRADLTRPTLFFGLSSSDTLRPEHADHFAFRSHEFEVMDMDGKRVDKVLVKKLAVNS